MRRAYVCRLYPNRNQRRELEAMLETHRRLYNAALEQRRGAWKERGESVSYGQQSAWYRDQRRENSYLSRTNFSSAQATLRRLDRAFRPFFRRVEAGEKPGYPRFKGRDRFRSIEFPAHGDGIRFTGNRLRVQHVGTLRVKRRKPVRRLQTVHQRVRNLRREHHHQVANGLIRRYGVIAVERLSVRGMLGNRRLSRAIGDAGRSAFVATLTHKAESAGARVIEVDPAGTSQECSSCGATVGKSLSVRWHCCPSCGLSPHRDENAARNVLLRGLARMGPAGRNVAAVRASVPREAVSFS